MDRRRFRIVLIKPSHYDADGYVIQWHRSSIPSNSLASVYGLLAECAEAKALGGETDIEIEAFDECNTIVDAPAIIRSIKAAGGGFVGLVGVRRYRALARRVLAAPSAAAYTDEALIPPANGDALPDFVHAFADKIPHTRGAPVLHKLAS